MLGKLEMVSEARAEREGSCSLVCAVWSGLDRLWTAGRPVGSLLPDLGPVATLSSSTALECSGLAWKAAVTGRKAPLFRTGPQWNERSVKPRRGSWGQRHTGGLRGSSLPRNQGCLCLS